MSSRSRISACIMALVVAGCSSEPEPSAAVSEPSAVASPLAAISPPAAPAVSTVMSCSYPVRPEDTDEALLARYPHARVETVPGPEGSDFTAVVLWPDEPTRRVELPYEDEERTHLGGLRVRSPQSAWTIAGIGIGTPIDQVERANRKPFTVAGFEWDYGGYTEMREGDLTRLKGGCGLSLRMSPTPGIELADAVVGDGVHPLSNDPALRAAQPTVSEITVFYDREK